MLRIFFNQKEKVVEPDTTLASLLKELKIQAIHGTAIAINEEIIPSEQWEHTVVQDQDVILMIEAVQGG